MAKKRKAVKRRPKLHPAKIAVNPRTGKVRIFVSKSVAGAVRKSNPNKKTLIATKGGHRYKWKFWRDNAAHLWFLEDHTGYVRTLEPTWRDSVHRIRTILENHGMEARVS